MTPYAKHNTYLGFKSGIFEEEVYVIMEDGTGIADVTVFSDVQEKCGQVLFREGWLVVEGKIQKRGPMAVSVIAEKLSPLSSAPLILQPFMC